MVVFALGVALLAALAIIGIGMGYLFAPRAMAPSFGLPLPAEGPATSWWLRPKGVRDVVAGVLVLAVFATGDHRTLGLLLLLQALIPVGDMATVFAARGRIATALGVHGATAAVMIVAAVLLLRAS